MILIFERVDKSKVIGRVMCGSCSIHWGINIPVKFRDSFKEKLPQRECHYCHVVDNGENFGEKRLCRSYDFRRVTEGVVDFKEWEI